MREERAAITWREVGDALRHAAGYEMLHHDLLAFVLPPDVDELQDGEVVARFLLPGLTATIDVRCVEHSGRWRVVGWVRYSLGGTERAVYRVGESYADEIGEAV